MKKSILTFLLMLCLTCAVLPLTKVYAEETTAAVPGKPRVENVVGGIRVKWDAVEGATKYGVWRSETGKNGTYQWLGNPVQTSYLDENPESGTVYYYKITCMDPDTNTHGEKSEARGILFLSTPDFTGRYNKAAGVVLEWNRVKGAQGYGIYRKSFEGTDAWVRIGTVEGNETLNYTDTTVKNNNGVVYRYAVRALGGSDLKTLSGCRSNGRTMVRLTSRVLNGAEFTGEDSIKCSWTTTVQATGYEIRFMNGAKVEELITLGNYKTGVKTIAGLESGNTYKVQVRSYKKVNGVGSFYSAWSEPKYVTIDKEGMWEEPYEFSSGDYITTEETVLDIGPLVYTIGADIYVPGNLEEVTKVALNAMEEISGIDFEGNEATQVEYADKRVRVNVTKNYLYRDMEWYTGLDTSEFGSAFAGGYEADIAPGDLLLGNSNTLIHELSHVLMFRQSRWFHSQLLNEGFAEYTTWLALLELEKNRADESMCYEVSVQSLYNMAMLEEGYEEMYSQPLEYWFENTLENSGNANYVIGFRFMKYLHDVYGDYSSWITTFEAVYPFRDRGDMDSSSKVEQQIYVLKKVYGEDVLDNFYPWLQEHQNEFDGTYEVIMDRSAVKKVNLYPCYNAIEEKVALEWMKYNDLYINLEYTRKYLTEYKKVDASALQLITDKPILVNLYSADGSYTQVLTEQPVSLDGVSYIKLVGEGTITQLKVIGFSDVE